MISAIKAVGETMGNIYRTIQQPCTRWKACKYNMLQANSCKHIIIYQNQDSIESTPTSTGKIRHFCMGSVQKEEESAEEYIIIKTYMYTCIYIYRHVCTHIFHMYEMHVYAHLYACMYIMNHFRWGSNRKRRREGGVGQDKKQQR